MLFVDLIRYSMCIGILAKDDNVLTRYDCRVRLRTKSILSGWSLPPKTFPSKGKRGSTNQNTEEQSSHAVVLLVTVG
jgi:hypothetical protein